MGVCSSTIPNRGECPLGREEGDRWALNGGESSGGGRKKAGAKNMRKDLRKLEPFPNATHGKDILVTGPGERTTVRGGSEWGSGPLIQLRPK